MSIPPVNNFDLGSTEHRVFTAESSLSPAVAWPAVRPTSEYSLVRVRLYLPVGPAGSIVTASSAVMARASSSTRAS